MSIKQEAHIAFEIKDNNVTVHLGSFNVDIPARAHTKNLEEFDKAQEHYQAFLLSPPPPPPTFGLSGAMIANIFTKLIDFVPRDKYP